MDEHISEDELAAFAFDPDCVPLERQRTIMHHTAECPACCSTLDLFMTAEDDLPDVDVWEPPAGSDRRGSDTREIVMAIVARIASEEEAAKEPLAPYVEKPALAAREALATRVEFQTAGVVRHLNAQARRVCQDRPLDAFTLAETAAAIADTLSPEVYRNALHELRGTAWLHQASALMLLGRCPDALDALTRAERNFKNLRSSGFCLSSAALVRAGVLAQQQRLEEAAAEAQRAEMGFAHLGDDDRRMMALHLRGAIKYEAQEHADAAALFRLVVEHGESTNDPGWIARGSYALGDAELACGNAGEASLLYHRALAIFRAIGPANERISAEWGVARVFLHGARYGDAIVRLRDVEARFEAIGMLTDAALVGLDIAEALLALGRTLQIARLAARLFRVFTEAGMLTAALNALAYIRESANGGTLTAADLQAARRFLRRVEREPDILFVPPPAEDR